jgi:hypothetical protein
MDSRNTEVRGAVVSPTGPTRAGINERVGVVTSVRNTCKSRDCAINELMALIEIVYKRHKNYSRSRYIRKSLLMVNSLILVGLR